MPLPVLQSLVFGVLLVWISVIDIERLEIPDLAALTLVSTGAFFAWQRGADIVEYGVAGLIWAVLFWSVGVGYAKLRGWEGLGFGDVKLVAGIGLWLGLSETTLVVFGAALAGILAIAVAKAGTRSSFSDIGTTAVAFGPFLCLSAWVIWLF